MDSETNGLAIPNAERLLTCVDGPCRGAEIRTAAVDGETVTLRYEYDTSWPEGMAAYDSAEYVVDHGLLHYAGGLA